jgi:RNA polymerase sigma-70 factor (ECF subfamily)
VGEGLEVSEDFPILVNRCIAGNQPAIGELVDRFRGQVFGLCYRMLGQREDAEDATQETFLRVVNNLHRWDPTRAFEPWLLTIAGNRCRTKLAKRKRRPNVLTLDYPVPDATVENRKAELLAEEVTLGLVGIRDEYRKAFLLFHQKEMSYLEIAEVMQVPLGTVKTWVHRARRELINRLRKRGVLGEGIEGQKQAI